MNDIIVLEDVSVRFNLASESINNLKEYVIKLAKRQLMFQEFYPLKNVSLSVKPGESVGLVGVNGSGKSTLLKVVCGVLKPYKGSAKVYGSIAPMIELGAGIDPDLTARENIFLNGAILGHGKKVMEARFDEIVDFAALGIFLDTPVKNFSSGMAARLAFAIATTIEPQILIVDEILSVGDYAFQQKCLARMNSMLEYGATLLYVSHSNESIKQLCTRAVWLDKGSVVMEGEVKAVCDAYQASQI